MVGLVIVSHSRALADALVGLLRQVAAVDLPVAVAAGIGEDRNEFGTDAVQIMESIQSVYSDAGVVVLMDLGSAVLSAKLALELLPPEMAAKVRLCGAPLVEGAVAAAVQIGLCDDIDAICREANAALLPKREQLGEESGGSNAPTPVPDEAAESITLTLTNLHGLHARPAAKFVQTAARFMANVTVTDLTNGKGPVSARSLNAIATLGAIENHQIRISASGEEAKLVLAALKVLIEDNFGEAPATATVEQQPTQIEKMMPESGALKAVPISEGFALAPLFKYQAQRPPIPTHPAENPEAEWTRLQAALETTNREISMLARRMKQSIGSSEGAIFDAHLLILQDPDLIQQARAGIDERHENAAFAWNAAITAAAESYRALDDPYLQQRAADVEDVGAQVLYTMMNHKARTPIAFEEPVILYAADLTPTETSQLDMNMVRGIITAGGGPTSHSAILSRALGIPAVAGTGTTLDRHPGGALTGLNGFTGEIWLDPSPEIQAAIQTHRTEWLASREKLLQTSQQLAHTKDGKRVEVFANIGGVNDARAAVQNGAEGVGLLRTEFLFLTRETAPSEEEQMGILREIFETMGAERPITIRTLDVGGDKELPYIQLPEEPNPFLGVRALRLSLSRPDLFLTQLRAILRAADGYPCRMMFPMVADVEEIRKARTWVEKAHAELSDEQRSHAWPVELGIMVEIPSAALLAPVLAREVDFFSIGTNDLTQYTLAAERGNPALYHLADGLHPAVLRLVDEVVEASHQAGKWTGICGELGGDPEATSILVGLGVDELSLNPAGIPRIKSVIRDITMEAAREIAKAALQCQTSAEVRELVRRAGL
ncbi:MAG TPA: phosphoenolpyruvate--protein phosphotransferase [Anaerolineales bacterium]|nr:phosphoenolpyruvate--protein phosphotransferase [Anaerolineales bacterium]